ncbi:MAG: DUF4926 domain-containing protein [Saprospiraceae bacterium]
MNQGIKLLDVVALLKPIPEHHLRVGQVGAVVEILKNEHFEIEFTDKKGRTITLLPISGHHLMVLQYELEAS